MKKIKLTLPHHSYDILSGTNTFAGLTKEIQKRNLSSNLFAVVDKSVLRLHKKKLTTFFKAKGFKVNFVEFKSREANKNFDSLQMLLDKMLKLQYGRDSLVVAIGGGIVGDVAGFTAACYMRGVPYIQVPTTILSAVDSSVGGKTGINFAETKNLIGAFHQPKLVLIDTQFYHTLPQGEVICGLGEVVKYAYLSTPAFFNFVLRNLDKIISFDDRTIEKVIRESVQFKADIVMKDEKETSIRSMLNLGHTFAHALEIQQEHTLKHGQAVIVGIACALHLSHKIGLIDENKLETFLSLILEFQKYIRIKPVNVSRLRRIMTRDKKASNGEIKFVLIKSIGEVVLNVKASTSDINYAIKKGTAIFQ